MRSELRAKVWFALAYFVALEVLLVGAILFWPNFEANIAAIKNLLLTRRVLQWPIYQRYRTIPGKADPLIREPRWTSTAP